MDEIRLVDIVAPERVLMLDTRCREDALKQLAETFRETSKVDSADDFLQAIYEREKILSTGIGLGIAIPHVHHSTVRSICAAVGVAPQGIPWEALDEQPAKIIFMIAAPEGARKAYLHVLAKVTFLLKHETFRERLVAAGSPSAVHMFLQDH